MSADNTLISNKMQQELKTIADKFESTIGDFGKLINDPNFYLHEYVHAIKNKIYLQREELKLKVDSIAFQLIDRVENFDEECKKNLDTCSYLDLAKIDLNKSQNDLSSFRSMRSIIPLSDEDRLIELFHSLNDSNDFCEQKLADCKNRIMNMKKCEFNAKNIEFGPENFGDFLFEPIVRERKEYFLEMEIGQSKSKSYLIN
jgi:hypothetical protein